LDFPGERTLDNSMMSPFTLAEEDAIDIEGPYVIPGFMEFDPLQGAVAVMNKKGDLRDKRVSVQKGPKADFMGSLFSAPSRHNINAI
jgi:hypothetical protein